MLERLEGTALLRFRVGESFSNLQMHSPSSWLSADNFITTLMDQVSTEVSYSHGREVKLPICKIKFEALFDCYRVLSKKAQMESSVL